jgi:CRISPR-associated exonuclease Cas4
MPLTIALSALVIGFLLILAGKSGRSRRGLTDRKTLDLDSRVLYSREFGISGRPDRLVRDGGYVIPEEWKSSLRVHDSHRAQLAVYFILLEQEYAVRPTHGFIVTGQGERHRMENTDQLRAWVLDIAAQIRAARRQVAEIINVACRNPRASD